EVEQSVKIALETGYRSIDTAAAYKNETGVVRAIKASGLSRKEIFLTTKVWNSDQGYEKALGAFEESLGKLDTDYADLYLIHWPGKKLYKETWKALEKLYSDGRVRAIGVSNFLVHHLEDLMKTCEVKPMVNQVEFHPLLVQQDLLRFCKEKGVQLEAWSPLMRGQVLKDERVTKISEKYGKTPAQILLRWDLQHGVVTIPKSVHRERIVENSRIFDFNLSKEDSAALDSLDEGRRIGPDPDTFSIDFV
ncbi:MAG TPA: aldo/keto reductase, partial [Spirochaetia bacterium]|nr:aldo/keto reductase [Spirochaetia bacterium]